ncbi:hypothetical protein C8R48DRAFT_772789 [Suillus tomentosus]|nr:hypothetical protein C8R48DRAFT_772789 [Suillus tomentosus]
MAPSLAKPERKLKKSAPSLVPASTTSKEPLPKKATRMQEKQSTEVALPTATDPSDDEHFPPGEPFTHGVREVLKYLRELAPEKNHREFRGVGEKEFELIEHVAGETGRLMSKPKFTYDYNELKLIVDMPSNLHEEPFDYLKDCLTLAIAGIPYDRMIVRPRIQMNHKLRIQHKSVTPDMTISISAMEGPTESVIISGLGECALTEDRDHVFSKMQAEVRTHPEVDFVVIVLIDEAMSCKSPHPDSSASKALMPEDVTNSQPLSLKLFIRQCSTPCWFDKPVKVADHNWCQVVSVEYYVWAKGDNGTPINIDNHDPQRMAHGTLVLNINMGPVTPMLERGLRRMKESMVRFTQEMVEDADCSALQSANVALPIQWNIGASGILSAIDTTAHQHYEGWFMGVKRDHDSTYSPSEPESPESQEPRVTRSRKQSTANQASSSQSLPRRSKTKGRGRASKHAKTGGASMGDR